MQFVSHVWHFVSLSIFRSVLRIDFLFLVKFISSWLYLRGFKFIINSIVLDQSTPIVNCTNRSWLWAKRTWRRSESCWLSRTQIRLVSCTRCWLNRTQTRLVFTRDLFWDLNIDDCLKFVNVVKVKLQIDPQPILDALSIAIIGFLIGSYFYKKWIRKWSLVYYGWRVGFTLYHWPLHKI